MIKSELKLSKEKKYYVACSGGVDSVACASFLKKNGYNIELFHFNHKFQDVNEEMEERVKQLAKHLDVPFYGATRVKNNIQGNGIEDELRKARLEYIKNNLNHDIIFCHHLNDCVESYLHNVFRGQADYCPIPIVTKLGEGMCSILRPFLLCTKEDFIKQVKANKLDKFVVVDPTNKHTKYLRNWIRHDIIPVIHSRSEVNLETVVHKIISKYYAKHQ